MNNMYGFSNGLKSMSSIATSVILLIIGLFLLKISLYLIPLALLAWGAYKVYRKIKLFIYSKTHKENTYVNSVESRENSIEIIQRAINNNEVIDVDYKEL